VNVPLISNLKRLRLSGLASILEVRLQEATGNQLNHLEFLELIVNDELDCAPETGHKRLGGFGTDWYFVMRKGWCHESETEVQCGAETAGGRATAIRDEQSGPTLPPV
jgi:hypothetical protein